MSYPDHQTASVTLRTLLLIFTFVLIGALAYFISWQYQQPDAPNGEIAPHVLHLKSKPTTTKTTVSTTVTPGTPLAVTQ